MPRRFAWIVLAGLFACGGERPEPPRRPDVIVVVFDTVRRDFLGFAGHPSPTSPHLDAFARRATDYPRAKAVAPWTLPSHASMFTGLYPFQHGARGYWQPSWTPEVARTLSGSAGALPLNPQVPTLAEWLRDRGYRTGAVAANDVFLSPRYGLDRGFEHYDVEYAHGDAVNRRAFAWVEAIDDAAPLFLFVNYMDAHKPYNVDPLPELGEVEPYDREHVRAVLDKVYLRDPPPSDAEMERVRRWYEQGIGHADRAFGELLSWLAERRDLDGALVIAGPKSAPGAISIPAASSANSTARS